MRHAVGDVLRTLAGAGQENAVSHRLDRSQFGMLLEEEPVRAAADPKARSDLVLVGLSFHTGGEHNHVHPGLDRLAGVDVGSQDSQIPIPLLDANVPVEAG
ncbi:MAG: hypothetical protein Q7R57_03860, partial [Dehalococcoidales bacterium]|nr:hypothetical protein [Dehalococcoidales bacterium]